MAMRARRRRLNPLHWLGPQSARSGRGLARRTRALLLVAIVIANIVGAVTVFVFANFVVPTPDLDNEDEIRLVNLIGFAVYLGGAIPTTAIAYLPSERVLRGATAAVMAAKAPRRPVVPGVAARTVIAWALGT